MTDVTGHDVIGTPGQNLSPIELNYLVLMADGKPPSAINKKLNIDQHTARHTESIIKKKLGANSKAHMIARAFVLSVLSSRALVVALIFLSCGNVNDNIMRTRQNSRTRSNQSIARTARSSLSGGASPA